MDTVPLTKYGYSSFNKNGYSPNLAGQESF